MTELFGPVGKGWKYEIDKLWTEPGSDSQVCAFALVSVCFLDEGTWSEPVQGIGGSMLVEKERSGLHTSDEAYKMATTDALSVALKALGVAAEVYLGNCDGSKYSGPAPQNSAPNNAQPNAERPAINDRIKKALYANGCRTKEDAAAMVKSATGFKGREGDWIDGKEDYTALSDKFAKVLAEKLERMTKQPAAVNG